MDPASGRSQRRLHAASLVLVLAALIGLALPSATAAVKQSKLRTTSVDRSENERSEHEQPTSREREDDDDDPSPEPAVVPDELVVSFDEGSSASQQRKAITKAGGRIEEELDSIDGAVITPRGNRTTDQVAERLARSDVVEFVEPNYVVRASRVPNDLAFGRLWGLRNTGQLSGTPGADISAVAAWDTITGSDVTVAILDTGIDYRHPDLDGNIWTNGGEVLDGADNDNNGFDDDLRGINLVSGDSDPLDDSSHGTHVAGIAGAEGDNVIGTVGVNWKVRLMALKFLDEQGEGSTADAAEAIDYAVSHGALVINASWGGPAPSQALYHSISQAGDQGALFVAAAGNEGENADSSPEYPAAFDLPNVISVAASDPEDQLLYFSNYGRRTVDLAAPGEEIYSTSTTRGGVPAYATYSGTSMAAPFVSGGAALYLARHPGSSPQKVKDALLQSVDSLPSLAGKTATGGRLNLARALGIGAAVPQAAPPPPAADTTPPSPFRLLRPRNRHLRHKRGLRFRWQPSHDASGIRVYKLYVDGKKRKTLRDPDGPGGRDPRTKTRLRLAGGRHRWSVRAYDYAGNRRTATRSQRTRGTRRVLFIRNR
jgi:subtilisin family serine protease